MEVIHNFNLTSLLDALISLAAAFGLGGLIAFERQVRQRTAGLRPTATPSTVGRWTWNRSRSPTPSI
jgi:hypothetical protein